LLTGTSPFPSSTDSTWGASESNSNERDWSLEFDGDDDFAKILSVLIPVHMPSAYVEYYADIAHTANDGTWLPARADVLVTANSFDGDEKWKIWAAGQVDQGAKLVIAQHGGHYGTGAWSAPQNHEIAIADRYLTWGWKDNRYHNVMPAPATKLIGLRRNRVRRSDLCLTALGVLPRYSYWIYSVPIAHQYERYLEDQIHFISCLSPDVRKSLEVRITKNDFGWDLEQRLKQFHSELIVDPGNSHFLHRLKKSRLFVATYNATTYLESFRLGVPTVMHWDPNYWEISSQAKPYFDLLSEAGVFFSDAEQCAEHVNEIWANVSQWWKAEKVQNAVEVFANEFAYVGERPLRELKRKISRFEKGSQSVVIDRHR
jgi:putative transferase (TIGR04331 family)